MTRSSTQALHQQSTIENQVEVPDHIVPSQLYQERSVRAERGADTLWLEVTYKGAQGALAYNSEPSDLFHSNVQPAPVPRALERSTKSLGMLPPPESYPASVRPKKVHQVSARNRNTARKWLSMQVQRISQLNEWCAGIKSKRT